MATNKAFNLYLLFRFFFLDLVDVIIFFLNNSRNKRKENCAFLYLKNLFRFFFQRKNFIVYYTNKILLLGLLLLLLNVN